MLEKYHGLKTKLAEFVSLARQLELLRSHYTKIEQFLQIYDNDNWVFEIRPSENRKGRRIEFKPIDVSPYTEQILFRLGHKVVMMSATILDKEGFCTTLGLDQDEVEFISIPSPFPIKKRPIFPCPIGKMSASEIDKTLPKLAEAIKSILAQHKNEKGIIHAHSYKIAHYLRRSIKSSRILIHDSSNRDEILQKHISSKKPTVLLSPSMTEGVDLSDDSSRFQIICKVPYPYLGDKLVKKRMNRWKWWYPMQTAKTIVQATGRSVRSEEDHAITYILDADWERFYSRSHRYFPQGFKDCIK
jgi:Rad3-related DNA helicase